MSADELTLDPGVLAPVPTLEFGGYRAAAATGGVAILPWRRDWLAARAAQVTAHPRIADLADSRFDQALVHLQKSRDATWQDLCAAWDRLASGGRLLLSGGNDLGVVSAVKRLARELAQPTRVLANRRHARIALFERRDGTGPEAPVPGVIEIPSADGGSRRLQAAAGVFGARKLDAGTGLLLTTLFALDLTPKRILDLGCGIGALGLSALAHWPNARGLLLDADVRAIDCASDNAAALGLADRCQLAWWDASESLPATDFDLVLLNPPFHAGKAVDLDPARELFVRLAEALSQGGRGLVVANRTLPYEHDLGAVGTLETRIETRGYKVLELRKRARSSSSKARKSPGARSRGRS